MSLSILNSRKRILFYMCTDVTPPSGPITYPLFTSDVLVAKFGRTLARLCAGICGCLTTDSLPRKYLGQLFGLRRVLELDGERIDSRFILVRVLDHDRVITLRPVNVSLCVGLIVLSCLSYKGAYSLSLYR
jgi:hypothetical protein